jgi:hypothetical protein
MILNIKTALMKVKDFLDRYSKVNSIVVFKREVVK